MRFALLTPLVAAPPRPCLAQRPMEPRGSLSDPAAEPRSDEKLERSRWEARDPGVPRSGGTQTAGSRVRFAVVVTASSCASWSTALADLADGWVPPQACSPLDFGPHRFQPAYEFILDGCSIELRGKQ